MNELQIKVEQSAGAVDWNFEELKEALSAVLSSYETTVYTEDTLKEAKADRAQLNKLRSAVDSRRKEIKKKCLEPYEKIEAQAKELIELIDKPVNQITEALNKYEAERRAKRKTEILDYANEQFAEFTEDIRTRAITAVYDKRMENKTVKEVEWKSAIDAKKHDIDNALSIIDDIEEPYRSEAMKCYTDTLSLMDAIDASKRMREHEREIEKYKEEKKFVAKTYTREDNFKNSATETEIIIPVADLRVCIEMQVCMRGEEDALMKVLDYAQSIGVEYDYS